MKYEILIIKMLLEMKNEDYIFKIYHYLLAKYRKEERKAEHGSDLCRRQRAYRIKKNGRE